MKQELLTDLASLCWVNPFGAERARLEKRLMGQAYKPIRQTGGGEDLTPNLSPLLQQFEDALALETRAPEYPEVASFVIYHELIDELDQLILEPQKTRQVWKSFLAHWDRYFDDPAHQPELFDQATLFALLYQIRRAFHWIFHFVIGSGAEAIRLRERIWESIFSHDLRRYVDGFHREMNDVHSLITGPSGSGKGLVARAIGLSRFIPFDPVHGTFTANPESAFFSVNVAVLPEQLLESVLFGHAKGSFTGAYKDHVGLFESTGPNGALFLDEMGEMTGAGQAKILTVLQERRFQRVGETETRTAYGRVIAATNRNLEEAVASGRFREDLYFRLSADRLETVPLKSLIGGKIDALRPMVNYITKNLLHESWTSEVVDEALHFIDKRLGAHYPWPGNFRELEQCLRNFLIHRDYQPVQFREAGGSSLEKSLLESRLSAEELLHRYAKALYNESGGYKAVGEAMGVDQRTAKKYVALLNPGRLENL